VLKKLFGRSFGFSGAKEPATGGPFLARADIERVKTLIEFFPIGKKLRYYPEFNTDIILDTLVLAYCVNGSYVYSLESIDFDADGNLSAFRSGANEVRTPVSKVKTFQVLVPDTSDLEMKLDYQRRALIGRGKQFNKGNYITLLSNAGARGVSNVDTEVAKQVLLDEGPYAHTKMVLLTPELHSLTVTDQRKKSRTKINVPVTVALPEETFSRLCTIVDISEGELRIRVSDRGTTMPVMRTGDGMIIQIELGESERHYTIKGSVIRRASETCVIMMDGQIMDGKLCSFSPLDLLELKAGLLNYGK
jgi:hypothetical protein